MNRGALAIREKLPERGGQASLVRALQGHGFTSVDASRVNRWFSGERKPDPKERATIEDVFGVGWRLWDEEIDGDAAGSGEHPAMDSTGTGDD